MADNKQLDNQSDQDKDSIVQLEAEIALLKQENQALKKKAFENLLAGREQECCQQLTTNKQAGKLRRKFMDHSDHEVRTSLNGILSALDVLSELITDEQMADYASMASSETLRLHKKLMQIFDLSKLETCGLDFSFENFNLKKCLDGDLYDLSFDAIGRDIEFSCFISPGVPETIRGDGRRLKQIIAGLVGNRVRHTHDRGAVAINVTTDSACEGDCVSLMVTVSDTGTPLAQDLKESIDDFINLPIVVGSYQALAIGSLSLDLVCALQMIKLMGGTIHVESCHTGNIFNFSLPFAIARKNDDDNTDNVIASFATLKGKNILLAEDDMINRILVTKLLEQQGVNVVAVEDGAKAVEAAKESYFDAIIMDIQMPVLDGLAASQQIRKLSWPHNSSKITALTAIADREQCLASGVNDFLAKPIDRKQLFTVISQQVSKKAIVVHDDVEQEAELVRFLIAEGWQVSTAKTSQQTLYEATLTRFDAYFLDCNLPLYKDKSVSETIRELDNYTGRKSLIIGFGETSSEASNFDLILAETDCSTINDVIAKFWS